MRKGKFIFAKPSFVEGVARLIDFGDTLDTYYYLSDEDEKDVDMSTRECTWGVSGTTGWYIRYTKRGGSSKPEMKQLHDASHGKR